MSMLCDVAACQFMARLSGCFYRLKDEAIRYFDLERCITNSGQIIATSHDLGPQMVV